MLCIMLECNTSHIPGPLADWGGLNPEEISHGFFLWVPDGENPVWEEAYSEDESEGIPPWLLPVLEHCVRFGVRFVLFDRDGVLFPGLPTFDW